MSKEIAFLQEILGEFRLLRKLEEDSNTDQLVAENMMQLGNICFAALALGQAFGGVDFNYFSLILGSVICFMFYVSGILLLWRKK